MESRGSTSQAQSGDSNSPERNARSSCPPSPPAAKTGLPLRCFFMSIFPVPVGSFEARGGFPEQFSPEVHPYNPLCRACFHPAYSGHQGPQAGNYQNQGPCLLKSPPRCGMVVYSEICEGLKYWQFLMLQEHKQAEALGTGLHVRHFPSGVSSCLVPPLPRFLLCSQPSFTFLKNFYQLSLRGSTLYSSNWAFLLQPVNPSFTHKYPVVLAPHYYIHLPRPSVYWKQKSP